MTINVSIPLTLEEVDKRKEDMPKGIWVFSTPLSWISRGNGKFYIVEDSDTEGVLYDSDWKHVMRVKYADYGLNPKDLS